MWSEDVGNDASDIVAVAGEYNCFVAQACGRDLGDKRIAKHAVRSTRDRERRIDLPNGANGHIIDEGVEQDHCANSPLCASCTRWSDAEKANNH